MDARGGLDEVARVLLERSFYLTALELYMEALEHNIAIAPLAAFFASFRPEASVLRTAAVADEELMNQGAQQLLQRFKESEEKLSLAHYQLEVARETVAVLESRGVASIVADGARLGTPSPQPLHEAVAADVALRAAFVASAGESASSSHEAAILNFLVRRHLLDHNLKVSAVTLAEEARLPRTWNEVSPHLEQPPPLSVILQYYYSAGANKAALEHAKDPTLKEQLEASTTALRAATEQNARHLAENARLTAQLAAAKSRAESLEGDKRRLLSELERARADVAAAVAAAASGTAPASAAAMVESEADTSKPAAEFDEATDDVGSVARLFAHRRAYAPADVEDSLAGYFGNNARVHSELLAVRQVTDVYSLANVVGSCLPHVVPHVVLRSRDEVVPVLVALVSKTDDDKTRDELMGLLFGLVKKPDAQQRAAILGGCVHTAQLLGPRVTEGVLVPQCWDSLLHKAEERRLLVAEFAGVMAPHLTESRRIPMMLNILKPLLEDPRPAVRSAAVRSLGTLALHASTLEQLPDFMGPLKRLLPDTDDGVCKVAISEYLPRLADLCASFRKLDVALLMPLLDEMEAQLGTQSGAERAVLRRLTNTADVVAALFPLLRRCALAWAPFSEQVLQCGVDDRRRFVLSGADESALLGAMREFLRHETDLEFAAEDLKWGCVQFLTKQFAPKLVAVFSLASFVERRAAYLALMGVLDAFWKAFDTQFTLAVFARPFGAGAARANLLPALVAGLHARGSEADLVAFFCDTLVAIGSGTGGWSYDAHTGALCDALELLAQRAAHRLDAVLTALRELIVHREAGVRKVCAALVDRLVGDCSEAVLRTIVLPALTTLVNDEDMDVRVKVARALVNVVPAAQTSQQSAKILEQVSFAMDALLDGRVPAAMVELFAALTSTVRAVDAPTRDRFLFPKLRHGASVNASLGSVEVANAIFSAYRAFLDCAPSREVLVNEVGPGLELLKTQLKDETSLASVSTALVTIGGVAAAPAGPVSGAGAVGVSSSAPSVVSSSTPSSSAPAAVGEPSPPPSPTPNVKPEDGTAIQKAKSLLDRFRLGGNKDKDKDRTSGAETHNEK